ncbi:hypothetical protein PFICI_03661 [Pestalotiopsis fici W106-1]|uniref:Uncharacterized protein n=1 Tax=Pestalotiopsis fici (strain W106-1 / CGMCC3.15140) TaxID=1229662 RepID=W3XK72_PESFW|nr:uncharacterized protein PFICI_03661 [Pestalotiopsis fici W106-1]ETS85636.1 hypothetical protein PFICI_03661 [Pestalotiopsis fici W106-1]
MNLFELALVALGAISVHTAWSKVRAWQNLRHIPGPFGARWSHAWLVKQIFAGLYVDRLQEIYAKYGPIVLLSPGMVAVSDPGRDSQHQQYAIGMGPGARYKKAHEVLRKKLVGGYSGKSVGLSQVHDMIDERVLKLVDLIKSKYVASVNHDQTFDLSRLLAPALSSRSNLRCATGPFLVKMQT